MRRTAVRPRSAALAASALGLGLLLGACGAGAVAQSDVEDSIVDSFEEDLPDSEMEDVSCEGDLPAEVDATLDCSYTEAGQEMPVLITVTSVEGSDVNYDIDVEVSAVSQGEVEASIVDAFEDSLPDTQIDNVLCEGDLAAEVGATLDCSFTEAGQDLPVLITVTEVAGSDVNYDIEVVE